MKGEQSGLLIAALVAIVAVVGLVILFRGASGTGAVVCPAGQSMQQINNLGGSGYFACAPARQINIAPASDQLSDTNTWQTHDEGMERRLQIAQREYEY